MNFDYYTVFEVTVKFSQLKLIVLKQKCDFYKIKSKYIFEIYRCCMYNERNCDTLARGCDFVETCKENPIIYSDEKKILVFQHEYFEIGMCRSQIET